MPSITFKWTIENFSGLNLKVNEWIQSPAYGNDLNEDILSIKFFPNGNGKFGGVFCSLCESGGREDFWVDFRFEISDSNSRFIYREIDNNLNMVINNECAVLCFCRFEDLITEMNNSTEDREDVLNIKCIMQVGEDCHEFKWEAKSKICMNQATFVWHVKEPDSSDWFQKKIFSCIAINALEVTLTAPEDDILINIKNVSNIDFGSQSVTANIILVDAKNIARYSARNNYIFEEKNKNHVWKFPSFFRKTDIDIKDGFFTLFIEFLVPNGIITHEKMMELLVPDLCTKVEYNVNPETNVKQNSEVLTALQKDLQQMLLDKKHYDVSLKAEGKLFCVHKCLLSSRSPVFRAMFDNDMIENQTNVVDIQNVDYVTLGSLLKFLYTGIIDASNLENILSLMLAADKYRVEYLTEKCAAILVPLLSQSNVCDIIAVADLVKHNILKATAFNLIWKHANQILSSTEWAEWSKNNVSLALEISSKVASQYNTL